MVHVIDTHALVWYLEGGDRLGAIALEVLDDATQRLIISAMVLCEAKYLSDRRRTRITFEEIINLVSDTPRCTIHPIDINVVRAMPTGLDIHDSIICGTALFYRDTLKEEAKVVTRDEAIRRWGGIETVW